MEKKRGALEDDTHFQIRIACGGSIACCGGLTKPGEQCEQGLYIQGTEDGVVGEEGIFGSMVGNEALGFCSSQQQSLNGIEER